MSAPRVLKLPENTQGRDFVVGDIHGAFGLVREALRQVRFDFKQDRLFSVGDLIDRGPESHVAEHFLKTPGVYAVRGNHDSELISWVESGLLDMLDRPPPIVMAQIQRMSMQWILTTPRETLERIAGALARLPIAMEIATSRGAIGLLHADVPAGMDWATFLNEVEAGNERVIETALWGRTRLSSGDDTGVPGVGRLFVGHTIQDQVQRRGNVYPIDTGGVFSMVPDHPGRHLTMATAICRTEDLVTRRRDGNAPVNVVQSDEDDPRPFGSYARVR